MSDRLELPTKAQIAAITDPAAVRSLLEAVENAVATIETRLSYSDISDRDWRRRAQGALIRHKTTKHQLARRLHILVLDGFGRRGRKSPRPKADNDPLTNQVLSEGVVIQADDMTEAEINDALEWLFPRIAAVEQDRADELDLAAGKRDEKFLSAANAALKAMRGYQNTLLSRRGALSRAVREADQARRERMFIDAVKKVLPEDTFKRLWSEVNEAAMAQEAA